MNLAKYHETLADMDTITQTGRVTKVLGFVVEADGPASRLGSICNIYPKNGLPKVKAEVFGFRDDRMLLVPLGEIRGIAPGNRVVAKEARAQAPVGEELLGRVIDGLGKSH